MAITQTSISYYGLNYVEHAERDFAEMIEHGCTTVILAVTEFDFDFWRPNIPKIVAKAHEMGLRVLIDPWGNGKYFGGGCASDGAGAGRPVRRKPVRRREWSALPQV